MPPRRGCLRPRGVRRTDQLGFGRRPGKLTADAMLPPPTGRAMAKTTEMVVCVGASTGGTEALREFLEALPRQRAGNGHRPAHAGEIHGGLRQASQWSLRGGGQGSGGWRSGASRARPDRSRRQAHALGAAAAHATMFPSRHGPLVSRHRPSVDVLFRSAARSAGSNAMGIIMTGMGDDGARGHAGNASGRRLHRRTG